MHLRVGLESHEKHPEEDAVLAHEIPALLVLAVWLKRQHLLGQVKAWQAAAPFASGARVFPHMPRLELQLGEQIAVLVGRFRVVP